MCVYIYIYIYNPSERTQTAFEKKGNIAWGGVGWGGVGWVGWAVDFVVIETNQIMPNSL
jgi:hypothetical protein